jgi:4-hydroxy-3-methylbut-2-enyl diphosphate reductase
MKILIAKTAGFCMGVRRAVEMVMDTPNDHQGPIFTFGPLIHNAQVLNLLASKGISILEEIPEHGTGIVLIRAHGVPPKTKQQLKKAGFTVIDATCPRVIKVQSIIGRHAKKGYASIIIGDRDHPEVIGLLGYAGQNGHVVGRLDELASLPPFDQAIVVAQTTQNTQFFDAVKKFVHDKHPAYKVFDTICDSTVRRQAEVKRLAADVDAVIVVGGRNSGNTQRLAEIAAASGKPTYHVETEEDLNTLEIKELGTLQLVGITAGASTPNWIIKRVYKALESFQFRKAIGWRRGIFTLQRTLLLTNMYVAIGAGCLCFACTRLLGIRPALPFVIIAMLYVQSMHILNHLTGRLSDQYNDPERASFYVRHRIFLSLLAAAAGGTGLLLAFTKGTVSFGILLLMSLLGLTYNLGIIPPGLTSGRYRRLRDIPGSKTLLIAAAWGVVTSLLPSLYDANVPVWSGAAVFLWSTGLVFVRTAFFDTLDMQGDRIVGKETIPILIGEKRSLRLLKSMLLVLLMALPVLSLAGLLPSLAYALSLCPVFIAGVVLGYERSLMIPGIKLEFLMESQFLLAGIITLLWSLTQ